MKNRADYSQYECPYAHLEKDCGHELKGPEGYENTYGVWCECGFRGPVFYLEPDELGLKLKAHNVEFSGGAPLFGAASAGTKGYASGGGNNET